MNSAPPKTEKDFDRDMEAFEKMPEKTKELERLRDLAEKAIGADEVALTGMIRDAAERTSSGRTGPGVTESE